MDYENKNWDSKREETFLKIFSNLHLNKIYDKESKGWPLENENNEQKCFLNDEFFELWVSPYIWAPFRGQFNFNYDRIRLFIDRMLKKYFKFNEFTLEIILTIK